MKEALSIFFKSKFFKILFPVLIIVILLWIIFLGDHNIFKLNREKLKNKELVKQKNLLKKTIKKDSIIIYKLKHDPEFLKKYAYEKFYLHNKVEDIYIFSDSLNLEKN